MPTNLAPVSPQSPARAWPWWPRLADAMCTWSVFAGVMLACGLASLRAQGTGQGRGDAVAPVADSISTTRSVLEKWVETRRLVAKEAQEWTLGKETLASRLELVKKEIETLRARNATAEASVAEADTKRAELLTENDERKATAVTLQDNIATLEQRTAQLLPRLPEPLRDRVKPLSQQLPKDPSTTKLSLGQRYQNVIGICNEIQKWNHEVTVTSEVRTLPDGSSVEVAVLYLGLGNGYYASGNGKVAGVGTATASAWVWQPANDAAADIKHLIAVFKNEQPAAYVRLPVQLL